MTTLFFLMWIAAQPVEVQLHYISPGVKCVDPVGSEAWCYGLEQYKQLLLVDNELFVAKAQIEEYKKIVVDSEQIQAEQTLVIGTLKSDISTLKGRADRLEQKFYACEDERQKFPWAEVLIGSGVGLVAGATVAAIVTFIVSR